MPALLQIAIPGAGSYCIRITTTEIFPEGNAEGHLDFIIEFFNMPGVGRQVGGRYETKVYSYRTHIARSRCR